MSSLPYLVTGAAGFIGSHSVDRLLTAGKAVLGVDNLRSGRLANLASARTDPLFEFVELDIADSAAAAALFRSRRFRGVLHLAALVSVPESIRQPALNARLNLTASDGLARLCVDHHCPRLVFASSAAVYGDAAELPNRETAVARPLSPYAGAKLAGEAMLASYTASYGLQTVCFRYFNIYGPRQDPGSPYSGVLSLFTRQFIRNQPVTVYGDGEQTRDFVAVADVAEANYRALTGDDGRDGVFNLCTGHALSLNQVLEVYRQRFPHAPPARYQAAREGDIRHSLGDPGLLRQRFGWAPETRFEAGLEALLAGAER